MKISIITSVWNNKLTVRDAIDSVLSQTYHDIEYIIIDGASTDGTVEIVQSYGDKITKFISEPDKGIYDGMNKGIELATGDIIGFLHSDDIYTDEYVISEVIETFEKYGTDSIYADLVYVERKNIENIVRYWKSGDYNIDKLIRGWTPPHPTFFVKKECYEKYGKFDLNLTISADYDFMLRVLGKHKISTAYLPKVIYKMRVGGASNKSIANIIKKSKEDIRALQNNNIGGYWTLVMKNLSKIPQFFKKR